MRSPQYMRWSSRIPRGSVPRAKCGKLPRGAAASTRGRQRPGPPPLLPQGMRAMARRGSTACTLSDTTALDSEEATEFTARLSRWSRQVLECLQTPAWHTSLLLGHACRGPINDMYVWLQAAAGDKGSTWDHPPLVSFVCSKALEAMVSFERLLGGSVLEPPWECVTESAGSDCSWRSQALLSLLETAADYWRRVYSPTTQYPLRVAWLVWRPADVLCPERSTVCQELLSAEGCSCLPLLRSRYGDELRAAAANGGKIDSGLYAFVMAVCRPQQGRSSSPRRMPEAPGRDRRGGARLWQSPSWRETVGFWVAECSPGAMGRGASGV